MDVDGCGGSRMDHRRYEIEIFGEEFAGRARDAGRSCGHFECSSRASPHSNPLLDGGIAQSCCGLSNFAQSTGMAFFRKPVGPKRVEKVLSKRSLPKGQDTL